MIVNRDDAVRRVSNRWTEYFSRMDQAKTQRAHRDLVTVDRGVLGVQCDDPKLFLLTLTSQPAEPL